MMTSDDDLRLDIFTASHLSPSTPWPLALHSAGSPQRGGGWWPALWPGENSVAKENQMEGETVSGSEKIWIIYMK